MGSRPPFVLGEGAQSVSQPANPKNEVEGHRSDASGQCQFAQSCASSATTISTSESTRGACGNSRKIARLRDMAEKESLVKSLQRGHVWEKRDILAETTIEKGGG